MLPSPFSLPLFFIYTHIRLGFGFLENVRFHSQYDDENMYQLDGPT